MMKSMLCTLFCATCLVFSCAKSADHADSGNEITGLWKSRDEKSDKPRSLVAIYKYQDKYYGRMLATYDDDGKINDTILEQKDKAKGVVGHPPYCGMDFVYNITPEQGNPHKYKGKIIDPEKGKVYNAEFWRQGDVLIVRGEVWIFGKNIPWRQASTKDLPKGFSMEEIKKFQPVVPKAL